LAAEIVYGITIESDSQFKFDGSPALVVTEIPDTFTKNSINYRPNLILCVPDVVKVSHNIQSSVLR
jgi:hypothetical protein